MPIPSSAEFGLKDALDFGEAFAWPLTIVAIAVLFKKQIGRKIEGLTTLKTPLAETSWNVKASTVAEIAEGLAEAEFNQGEVVSEEIEAAVDVLKGQKNDQDSRIYIKYSSLLNDASNVESVGEVIVLWNVVQQAISDLAKSKNIAAKDEYRAQKYMVKTKVLPVEIGEIIDQLRKLRNEVVHLKQSDVDVAAYKRSVLVVLEAIDTIRLQR